MVFMLPYMVVSPASFLLVMFQGLSSANILGIDQFKYQTNSKKQFNDP